MFNINCTINNCLFCENGNCTLTHVSSPSNFFSPDCFYFRPKNESSFNDINENPFNH